MGDGPKSGFGAIKIADRVYWVGAIDWRLRDFHGYQTARGSSYNAYLVLGEQVTLIDTVKASHADEMMARIASVIDPQQIRCIVSNHAEMDHSGALPQVVAAVRPETVVASTLGAKALQQHFHWTVPVRAVKDGERLSLGDTALRFVETRMLHWPDSMFSFLEDEGVLFSNDAFGMHLASSERFVDEVDPAVIRQEAVKYYANILTPFSGLVTKLVERLPGLGLDVRMIAPDHGPIWRRSPQQIVQWYAQWAAQPFTRKAVVAYDTMWQSTERMAWAIADGLQAGGARALAMPMAGAQRSDVAAELLEAGALLVGSPTMNGEVLPRMADLLTYLRGLKPRNLIGAAFGSYGWGGEAVRHLQEALEGMKIEIAAEAVRAQYVPDDGALAQCRELGGRVAARLLELAER
jgi:flavorubredoxin